MLARLNRLLIMGAILILPLIATAPFTSTSAEAAPPRCGKHTSIVDLLKKKYGETPRSIGMVSDQGVMQVFVSPEKGTWTILMTSANGQTCLIAAGQGWEELEQKVAKEDNA